MSRRLKRAGMAAAGLAVALAPVATAEQPAHADRIGAQGSSTITFTDTGGHSVTCRVVAEATHNTSDATVQAFATSDFDNAGGSCANAVVTLTVSAKDENGALRDSAGAATNAVSEFANHTVSAINVTADVHYQVCDPQRSASCDTSVRISPK